MTTSILTALSATLDTGTMLAGKKTLSALLDSQKCVAVTEIPGAWSRTTWTPSSPRSLPATVSSISASAGPKEGVN
eukprot:CAMPEP_0184320828 /NCGR_PEP_ID=MMETSP1049-20130417/116011_1 /TAXON_ID=77928 /ORGANISM="Proteomonas sulcata, Strain CCMP704" /LENGTH=75 /DNA_ID=CAMNT_0026641443 /DNA_START=42 /DNA_END=266 /DNA_ORIENTATION=-